MNNFVEEQREKIKETLLEDEGIVEILAQIEDIEDIDLIISEIVSDTIIATAEWSKKMLKDYGLDDEFTDNEIDELIRQAKESK